MGSKRKKAEKQKDFVKPKLRVGKTAAKPENHTDTSFIAKSISIPNQTINKKSSNTENKHEVDLTHHLSLTKHHSDATRKEVLNYIEQHLPSNPSLYKDILTSIVPLIIDQSQNVRNALISLLSACATQQVGLLDLHIRSIILFIHLAMSHIKPDIRNSSTKFLSVLIDHATESLVRSYFIKTLRSYFTLLSWTLTNDKKAVSFAITTNSSIGGPSKKARIHHLSILRAFLSAALFPINTNETRLDYSEIKMIHPESYKYLIPSTTQPFASLKLFVQEVPKQKHIDVQKDFIKDDNAFSISDLDTISTEDLDTRRKVMLDVFMTPMVKNLKNLIKEGGEVGREAHSCMKVLEQLQTETK